ncbi:twin arginine-targeting protein translocase TatB [Mycobacteroides abscessus subsp. abscessus]|uniref:twin-arginine translocase TatA/TatE family subunit n=1 Tax=Dermabacter TaxID=36739 RepID=UPI000927669C|nr:MULTISPECIES: twin-arginine translocase TatA/TatE family subunit [Dermabacter]MCG7443397.1 twin-arginine translocase TatA/TatE family subunit [Dermabacter vaginalis]SHW57574.1 twin arginine-targeting protein translocase TatB [Mycobacteroides abscessus subsp. abscessus]
MGQEFFLTFGGWELLIIALLFVILVGPQRLPEYTRKVIHWVRDLRKWADESRASIEDEMGIAVDDLKKYDPRQYDPRKIIREAWDSTGLEDDVNDFRNAVKSSTSATSAAVAGVGAAAKGGSGSKASASKAEEKVPDGTPFDPEAT